MTAILDFESEATMTTTPRDAASDMWAALPASQREAILAHLAATVAPTYTDEIDGLLPPSATRRSRAPNPATGLRDGANAARAAKYGTTAYRNANLALYAQRGVHYKDTDVFRVVAPNPKRSGSAGYKRFAVCEGSSGCTITALEAAFTARGWAIYFAEEMRYNLLDGLYTVMPA